MRFASLLVPLSLSLSMCACGEDGAGPGGAGGAGTGAGSEGGAGGSASCPEGSHPGESGCEATLAGWTAGPELERARDHHVSFVAETPSGTFVFAMLGSTPSGSASDTVERSLLGPDGTLGAFTLIEDFPEAMIGPGFAQVGASFVLAGGLVLPGNSSARSYVGRVGDDGSLTVTPGGDLASSRYHVTVTAVAGFVFAIGGMRQDVSGTEPVQEVMAAVERASFDGTTLGPWEELAPLETPVTHHAAVAHGGAIYLIGGGAGLQARTDILRATVAADGTLGAFTIAGALPEGRATSSAFVHLDHLYVFAGMKQLTGQEVATVLRAPIDAAGAVGSFEELPPLPLARAHAHQAPKSGPFVLSLGGSIHHETQREVFVGRFE